MKKTIIEADSAPFREIDGFRRIASNIEPMYVDGVHPAVRLLNESGHLWLKDGFSIGSEFIRTSLGDVMLTWAVPKEFEDEGEVERVRFSEIPRPLPESADPTDAFEELLVKRPLHGMNIMEAVDGDRTPISYLLASMFAREILDLGASWHGTAWAYHRVLSDAPWNMEWRNKELEPSPERDWVFIESRPEIWAPVIFQDGDEIKVRFHTYCALGEESIYEFTDTYRDGGYAFEWEIKRIAKGRMGFMV